MVMNCVTDGEPMKLRHALRNPPLRKPGNLLTKLTQ